MAKKSSVKAILGLFDSSKRKAGKDQCPGEEEAKRRLSDEAKRNAAEEAAKQRSAKRQAEEEEAKQKRAEQEAEEAAKRQAVLAEAKQMLAEEEAPPTQAGAVGGREGAAEEEARRAQVWELLCGLQCSSHCAGGSGGWLRAVGGGDVYVVSRPPTPRDWPMPCADPRSLGVACAEDCTGTSEMVPQPRGTGQEGPTSSILTGVARGGKGNFLLWGLV